MVARREGVSLAVSLLLLLGSDLEDGERVGQDHVKALLLELLEAQLEGGFAGVVLLDLRLAGRTEFLYLSELRLHLMRDDLLLGVVDLRSSGGGRFVYLAIDECAYLALYARPRIDLQ